MASVQGSSSSPSPSPSPPLRLFVDKRRNKVVVGEASGDFIDALLSFLTLPLGTIIRLSNKQTHQSVEVGCINNIYQSVQNFHTQVFLNGICKKMLLSPRNPCEKLCQKLRFNVDDTEPHKYFMCRSCKGEGGRCLSTFAGARCSCGKSMYREMKFVEGEEDNNPKGDGVFVRGKSMYLIFDDLTILQNSARNTVHQLAQLCYTDFTKLTEITPDIGLNQIMDLLKCALISTSSLTDVFLAQEAIGSKTVSSFTPILASQNLQESGSSYNLHIIVSKSKNEILYAEAEEDFTDFLFSFLTVPLGSTLKLLDGKINLGSMHNLYKSVKGLNPSLLGRYRSLLLDLKVTSQYGCKKQLLDVREEEIPCYYYGTSVYRNNVRYIQKDGVISEYPDTIRGVSCVELFDPRCAYGSKEVVGFVRKSTPFVVMDDLQVTPLTSTSTLSFLQKLKVPLDDLEEHKVTIHKNEALNLLGASLTSKAALTNGLFYKVNMLKDEATT